MSTLTFIEKYLSRAQGYDKISLSHQNFVVSKSKFSKAEKQAMKCNGTAKSYLKFDIIRSMLKLIFFVKENQYFVN